MGDVMLFGVLRMPYEMAMRDELSRRQFYDRVQQATDRLAAEADAMLNLEGNLCEVGEVEPDAPGFRIERADGSILTVTGLTREEVQALGLYVDVALTVTAKEAKSETA
jgi:hypothetical protein